MTQQKLVIIDNDVGLDDIQTIIYALANPNFEVLALTLVSGNASMNVISENLRRVLSFLSVNHIPVYEGGSYNLEGEYVESDGYFGKNAMANIELPPTNISCQTDMKSPLAMIHYARKYPKKVHFICIGPLTNLALAFLIDNEFPSYVGSIVMMNSDTSLKSIKQVTEHAEFNTKCDPLALRIVCEHFVNLPRPIMLVNWTFVHSHLLPDLISRVSTARKENPHNKFLDMFHMVTDSSNDIIRKNHWDDKFLTSDLFTAVVVDNPGIVLSSRRAILEHVEICSHRRGHNIYRHQDDGNIEIIERIDLEKMTENVVKVLLGRKNGYNHLCA